ncbi:hypothetical protein RN001_009860 [Aquatica leii]|uniref:Uncharacterized protein n=1 Tax=Aquatica leii TaxID=1421715 RepID=A0AAN7PU64_9COLE|nr:hypothetical protein RN001_009860 [Aquatica leii]
MSKKTADKLLREATCYKQLTMSHYCLISPQKVNKGTSRMPTKGHATKKKKTPTKGKLSKSNTKENLSMLTWIRKEVPDPKSIPLEQNKINDRTDIEKDLTNIDTKTIGDVKQHSYDSFAKYGVKVPTLDDIINHQKKLERLEKIAAEFELMDDYIEPPMEFHVIEPKKSVKILGCKHLTDDQLKVIFQQNYQYLYDIHHGISFCERYIRFQKEDYRNNFTVKDLKYNTSMITFKLDQILLLVDLLFEKFDDGKYGSAMQYFFKVLLPELCKKIFMDTHNMTDNEATVYLDNRPVE